MVVLTDPISYFADCHLNESLLLRFLCRPEKALLDLVVSYAAEVVSKAFEQRLRGQDPLQLDTPPTDFRHFRLEGVKQIQIEALPGFPADWEAYELLLLAKPQVLTEVEHRLTPDGFQMSFVLGKFGRHSVCYSRFLVESRLAVGVQVGESSWQYRDIATQSDVDFFNPFPSTMQGV
jgi:hypothetical protein